MSLSPSGAAPTTTVPARPGEALVEKKGAAGPVIVAPGPETTKISVSRSGRTPVSPPKRKSNPPVKAAAAKKTVKTAQQAARLDSSQRTPGGVLYPLAPGRTPADYRFWELASANWSRVSVGHYAHRSGSLSGYRAVYPIDKAIIPSAAPVRPTPRNFW